MERKIRILSFQNAYNFGAISQAYGLQQTIKNLGYKDVKFINYNPKYLSERYSPFLRKYIFPNKSIRGVLSWFISYPVFLVCRLRRNNSLRRSIKNLLEQTKNVVIDQNGLKNEEADILICGSDQVWNTSLTGSFDPVFLGRGPYKYLGYTSSYAPSTELSALTEEKARELSSLLDGFKFVSVRETQIKVALQKYTTRDIKVCVDPTILCGVDAFNAIASPRHDCNDYIVVYAYNPNDPLIIGLIKKIPNYQRYRVHTVLLDSNTLHGIFKRNIHSAITVQDFLSYIKYAKYVVTNSFHGLAFSLLFEKNFNVAFCDGKYVRCLSLLQQLGIENRFVRCQESIQWNDLDYSVINNRVNSIRDSSLDFIKTILEG